MVAGDAELKGRTYVTCELHTLMGNPMLSLRRELFRGRAAVPDAFDSFRQVDAALRETLMLDWSNAVTVDWPGTLFGSLRQIQGAFGCRIAFDAPEVLSMADRAIARLVLDDLARNAAAAGSSRVHLSLSINGEDWVVEAFDDAPCFLPGQWLQIGGGLERLARRLATSSGGLRLVEYEETQGADGWTKCVVAQWTSHREAKGQG
ncbi:MAG: ATP-binding protein [Frankiales bacterium]|nr:ATP-binding protein [Frankiales bacterium]